MPPAKKDDECPEQYLFAQNIFTANKDDGIDNTHNNDAVPKACTYEARIKLSKERSYVCFKGGAEEDVEDN